MRYLIAVCLAIFATFSQAASLTDTQKTTLKTVALADPVASQYVTSPSPDNDKLLAQWFNGLGACVVWRTAVPVKEYRAALTWTSVDGLTSGKARIWEWITANMTIPIDASDAAIRQGIADAWGAASATAIALTTVAKRTGTRAESALATGTCTTASPGLMGYEGQISQGDASLIRSMP